MRRVLPFVFLGAALVLSACGAPGPVTRDAPLDLTPAPVAASEQILEAQDWQLANLVVDVPRSLTVSEANGIKPRADIVWREDPLGDRHLQVANVMRGPLREMLGQMAGQTPVDVYLVMQRFHAVTERTRYTLGGEHEIEFELTVRHAETGAVLRGPEHVDLTFRALGGAEAIAAERQGVFQRDRIHTRVRQWASTAFGVSRPYLGLAVAEVPSTAPLTQGVN